ncbi:hypothetical protein VCR4J5_670113 [Vibrio crassostreae]|uniref:DUF723 domain-containing protein n=1 Tax=Vibrio crassostreae TaxID=246167 RepID=A0ABM9QXG0_9VIBR|nr:hypothetical protein VCR4J5_670113 [Vibrio crassostreae]
MLRPSRQERANHFIEKSKLKYGERYDYSKMKYVNRTTPVEILCPEHGAFHTTPNNFLATVKKIGCPLCRVVRRRQNVHQKKPMKRMKSGDVGRITSMFVEGRNNITTYC